jgi:ankyrin repeat protein
LVLIQLIESNDLDRFEELLKKIKGKDRIFTPSTRKLKGSSVSEGTTLSKIDEFKLLMEIVRHDRVSFLQLISDKSLLPITQKDEYTGDNLLHYAVLSKKSNFIIRVKAMFENEINNKNEQGNTPFHLACLLGDLELV